MRIVSWNDNLSIGISKFDLHHQHLLELLNNAYNATLIDNKKSELEYLLHELIEYANYHFKAEEEIMIESKYPRIESHLIEHENFTSKILEFANKFLSGESLFNPELVIYLEEWLLNHITKSDRDYANFLTNKGINIT